MAYNPELALRLRDALAGIPEIEERKMFGGLAMMVRGHMTCGVIGDDLIVRVGTEQYEATLSEPGARPFDFSGRPMSGWVYVAAADLADEAALQAWVQRGLDFTTSLPPK